MPIHDWTRASEAAYHGFQLGWITQLSASLNRGLLPKSYYAITETLELRPNANLCELSEPEAPVVHRNCDEGLLDAADTPPRTAYRTGDERTQYACRIVTVRDDLNQPLSATLFVTQQDKQMPYRLDAITDFAPGALTRGIHLLIVDLFPPSKRDPQGIHKVIWDRIKDEPFELPPDKPLTLAAYSAGTAITGYIEPLAVGDSLPDMPIFLTPDRYVPCPLESTYQASWDVFPKALKAPLLESA
jgi:hypothetical protein